MSKVQVFLAARRATEGPYLDEVRALSRRTAVVDLAPEPPRGAARLLGLVTPEQEWQHQRRHAL